MAKKPSMTPFLLRPREKTLSKDIRLSESVKPTKLWIWLSSLLLVGLIILGVVSFASWNWLRTILLSINTNNGQPPIAILNVQRMASYADLNFTLLNAQYAASFLDDAVHPGQEVVRLNMRVVNTTSDQIAIVYYDIARLLAPKMNSIAPTNVRLSADLRSGAIDTGWIDFPIAKGIQLSTLKLQLGSVRNGETLVTIPFSGFYDSSRDSNRISPQTLVISYNYGKYLLIYHLTSVNIRYGYRGSQIKTGQQFYVLNFRVDNPNNVDVSPGSGFDYVRLVLNGINRPPIDATLPTTFKAGVKNIGGHVVFTAAVGMKMLTIGFLLQVAPGQQNQTVGL